MGRKPRVCMQGCFLGLTLPRHYLRVEIGSNDGVYCRGTRMGRMKPIRPSLWRKLFFEKDEKRCSRRIENSNDDEDGLVKNKGKPKKGESNNAFSASCFGLLERGVDKDNEDSENKIRVNEVAGSAPSEKRITELLNVGKDKRALKVAKRELCTYKRAKKREKLVLQKMK